MTFKIRPSFDTGYAQIAEAYCKTNDCDLLNRPRLKRLFKLTVWECEQTFLLLEKGQRPNQDELAERIAAKFRSGILLTIAIAVVMELVKLWIQKLWNDFHSG